MALADRLGEPQPTGINALLEVLNEEDRATLLAALHPDSGYMHTTIYEAIRDEDYGVSVSVDQVRRYRAKLKEPRHG